jgi:magnesium transporter
VIVDCAVYDKGVRRPGKLPLDDALDAAGEPGSFTWIGLHKPTPEEFVAVRNEFGLHDLAVEDAVKAHQRPKLEVYDDDDLFVVLKTARYLDASETVEFAEIQLFVGANYVVAVRHGEASALADVRRCLEEDPAKLCHGPMSVLHAVMDRVVDDYSPVIAGLDNDIREIEGEVFAEGVHSRTDPTQRIFKLKREVLDFHRHTKPLLEALDRLHGGRVPGTGEDLEPYFRDVHDHLLRVVADVENFRDLLSDALNANLAQVSVRQNDDMRKISAAVAVGAVPTVVGAIYGMNFEHMPELGWAFGYPFAMGITAVGCLGLYRRFKKSGWL